MMNITKSQRLQVVKDLRKAAELIDAQEKYFCCWAIGYDNEDARYIFKEIFEKDARDMPNHNWDCWFQSEFESDQDDAIRQRRVMGLLLAAEIVENGDEP